VLSGRDPLKIEKLGSYYCRYVAKSLVHNGFCHRCEVSASFVSGGDTPINVRVNSFESGVNGLSDSALEEVVKGNF
jgi:S-adenosylmethionine synthetase